VGALRAAQRLQARRFASLSTIPCSTSRASPCAWISRHVVRQGSEPRAHVRLHAGRRTMRSQGSRWAAASTTRS
jgi:hypothetical protein